jgi:hypothetical protein
MPTSEGRGRSAPRVYRGVYEPWGRRGATEGKDAVLTRCLIGAIRRFGQPLRPTLQLNRRN